VAIHWNDTFDERRPARRAEFRLLSIEQRIEFG